MVKKLYRYEFSSLGLWMGIVWAALILMSGVTRLTFTLITGDDDLSEGIRAASVLAFGLIVVFSLLISVILPVVRFYKHMLTHEGYLTMSLPITVNQHLICKLVVALLMQIGTFIAVLASGFVFVVGTDVWRELIQDLPRIWDSIWVGAGINVPFYIIEYAILMLVGLALSLMIFYFCMAMGQLFGKNRIIGSVAVYILLDIAGSAIGTVLTAVFMPLLLILVNRLEVIQPAMLVHIALCSAILLSAALFTGFYAITHYMFSHKLNLE